jgi:hypothetical protein
MNNWCVVRLFMVVDFVMCTVRCEIPVSLFTNDLVDKQNGNESQ